MAHYIYVKFKSSSVLVGQRQNKISKMKDIVYHWKSATLLKALKFAQCLFWAGAEVTSEKS